MKTQKGDFIEIVYVGRLEDGTVFDLNDKEVAKKENINSHMHETIICLGQHDVVKGLDEFLVDKEVGQKLEVEISPEKGFGKRAADLFQMIPMKKFKEQDIRPVPGLQLDIDNMRGVVKTVSGGRILVDFNHPLAGKKLHYEVTIKRKVDNVADKVKGFLLSAIHLHDANVTEKEGTVTIKAKLPEQIQPMLTEELKKRITEVKSVKFEK